MSIAAKGPFGRGHAKLGDDGFAAVRGRQVELTVVVRPVKAPRFDLNRRPEKPVAENIHAIFGGDAIVARPICLGWVRFAEVDRAIGERGKT